MLWVAAEVTAAMVAVDVLFAVEVLPLLQDSGEEVTGGKQQQKQFPPACRFVGRSSELIAVQGREYRWGRPCRLRIHFSPHIR